jgi:flagellar biosynthesis protein FlhB
MAEKTEKATPKKLKDARKKGQVAKVQDMPAAVTFVVSILGSLAMVSFFFQNIGSFLLLCLRSRFSIMRRKSS